MARTAKQKAIRKLKYTTVANYTGDTAKARRARDLSAAKIRNLYGITLPKSKPKRRTYTEETYKRHQREIKKFKQLRDQGVSPKKAVRLKRRSFKDIKRYIKNTVIKNKVPDKPIKAKQAEFSPFTRDTRNGRLEVWRNWSKEEGADYPQNIKQLAYKVNRAEGFDDNAGYGWGVVNYAYLNNVSIDEAIEKHEPDRNYAGELYERLERITA